MEPKRSELSDPKYKHLDEAVRQPETMKAGYVSLGKAARHQAEAGGGTGPNPSKPTGGETPAT